MPLLHKDQGPEFFNGTIEVELAGKRQEQAYPLNRVFVGIAFRISDDDKKFECFYLRAANEGRKTRCSETKQRNIYAHPDFNVEVLRKDFPEKYESYVDMVPGAWTNSGLK